MTLPRSLIALLQGCSWNLRAELARHWGTPHTDPEPLAASQPTEDLLFDLVNQCSREERWTLFDIIDQGGAALANLYPRRLDHQGERIEVDIEQLRVRGLLFRISISPNNSTMETFFIIPQEFWQSLHRYREQVLVLKVVALHQDLLHHAPKRLPRALPSHIQPHYPLSHLVASGDPEGFRLPLSRAFAIPEFFPAKIKNTLKKLLHDFYLLFLPQLGSLRDDRAYSLDRLVSLAMGLAALISHHHSQAIDAELCSDEERRPFASPNVLLSGARRPLWRSFFVLFNDQFLSPIGSTCMVGDEYLQIYPISFQRLDLEVQPSRWIRNILRELEQSIQEHS
jgi:hypothetical protein